MRKLRLFSHPTTYTSYDQLDSLDEAYGELAFRDEVRTKRFQHIRTRRLHTN